MARITNYLGHWLRSKTKHGVHSPFVYDFVTRVLPQQPTEIGAKIDGLRRRLARGRQQLEIHDLGAGYGGQRSDIIHKQLSEVVRSSARGRREGELLARVCRHYERKQLLELGTNLGFSGLYLQAGMGSGGQFHTVEGAASLLEMARGHFAQFGFEAQCHLGDFEAVLREQMDWEAFRPDFVLLDGNHRLGPTLGYFEYLLPRLEEGAIIVLDDIYWSGEMELAWRQIIAHARVTVSLDLYHLGICFLDRPQAKEHFRLRLPAW